MSTSDTAGVLAIGRSFVFEDSDKHAQKLVIGMWRTFRTISVPVKIMFRNQH